MLAVFAHELYAGLVAPRATCDRPRVCMAAASVLMDDVVAQLYLNSFSDKETAAFRSQVGQSCTAGSRRFVRIMRV